MSDVKITKEVANEAVSEILGQIEEISESMSMLGADISGLSKEAVSGVLGQSQIEEISESVEMLSFDFEGLRSEMDGFSK